MSMLGRRCVVGGLLALVAGVLAGCGQPTAPVGAKAATRTYDKPVPPAPPAGNVRIVAEKVVEDATTSHWKWTIVGDRNWNGTSGSSDGIELKDAYPLKDPNRGGGTNAFECEVIVSSVKSSDGKVSFAYQY